MKPQLLPTKGLLTGIVEKPFTPEKLLGTVKYG